MPKSYIFTVLVAGLVAVTPAAGASADPRHDSDRVPRHGHGPDHKRGPSSEWRAPVRHGSIVVVPPARIRHYRDIVVVRPHGHWYRGYGLYRSDAEAYQWLPFTIITLGVLDLLSEAQQRTHEAAQVRATTAPVGETIRWNDGDASGAVSVLRDGVSTAGRYCREFQQTVTIGGRSEEAYGTACRQPDGTWEVVSTQG